MILERFYLISKCFTALGPGPKSLLKAMAASHSTRASALMQGHLPRNLECAPCTSQASCRCRMVVELMIINNLHE